MRLIDADAAIDMFQRLSYDDWNQGTGTTWANAFSEAADMIEDLPPADAVKVVRCKECQYWQDNNGGYPNEECRWGHNETPDAEDFCSFAERRQDETN